MNSRHLTLSTLLVALSVSAHALKFDFGDTSGYTVPMQNALTQAGNNWASRLTDDMTVKINFSFAALGDGALGGTGSYSGQVAYSDYRNALLADAKSALDVSATASLGVGTTYQTVVNGVSGVDPNNLYFANLSLVNVNTATLHSIGLATGYTGPDANMELTNRVAYDFNPDDGITAGTYDFVGIVTHELGHALGFDSGVDTLEYYYGQNSGLGFNDYNNAASPLDLFRYQTFSNGAGGTVNYRSLTLGNANKYFSTDGGLTLGAQFATGAAYGDGGQASHWKDDRDLGVMDPTANADGSVNRISLNDLSAMDAIGYDLKTQAVPEPASFVALGGALVVLARRRRR